MPTNDSPGILDSLEKLKGYAKGLYDKAQARESAKTGGISRGSANDVVDASEKLGDAVDRHSPVGAPLRKAVQAGDASGYPQSILDGESDAPSWEDLGRRDMQRRGIDSRYGAPGAGIAGGAAQSILEGAALEGAPEALEGAVKGAKAAGKSAAAFGRASLHELGPEAGVVRLGHESLSDEALAGMKAKVEAEHRSGLDADARGQAKTPVEEIPQEGEAALDPTNPDDLEKFSSKVKTRLKKLQEAGPDNALDKLSGMDEYALKKAKKEGRFTDDLVQGRQEPQGPDTPESILEKARSPQVEDSPRTKQKAQVEAAGEAGKKLPPRVKVPGTDLEGDLHGDYNVLDYGNELHGAKTFMDQTPRRIELLGGEQKLWRLKPERNPAPPGVDPKKWNDVGSKGRLKDKLTGRDMGVLEDPEQSSIANSGKVNDYVESMKSSERGHAEDGRLSEDPDQWQKDMGLGEDAPEERLKERVSKTSGGYIDPDEMSEDKAQAYLEGAPKEERLQKFRDRGMDTSKITTREEASESGREYSMRGRAPSGPQMNTLKKFGYSDEDIGKMTMWDASQALDREISSVKARKSAPASQAAPAGDRKLTDQHKSWLNDIESRNRMPVEADDEGQARDFLTGAGKIGKAKDIETAKGMFRDVRDQYRKAVASGDQKTAARLDNWLEHYRQSMNGAYGQKWQDVLKEQGPTSMGQLQDKIKADTAPPRKSFKDEAAKAPAVPKDKDIEERTAKSLLEGDDSDVDDLVSKTFGGKK